MKRRDRVVLDTLLPGGAHPLLSKGLVEAGLEDFLCDLRGTSIRRLQLGFRLALFAATWIAPALILRMPPITMYGRATREQALEAMATSRLYVFRQLFGAMKLVASLCYGADQGVRDAIGYPLQHDDPRRGEGFS